MRNSVAHTWPMRRFKPITSVGVSIHSFQTGPRFRTSMFSTVVRIPWSSRQSVEKTADYLTLRGDVPEGVLSAMLDFVLNRLYYQHSPYVNPTLHPDLGSKHLRVFDISLPPTRPSAIQFFTEHREHLVNTYDFCLGTLYEHLLGNSEQVRKLNDDLEEARSIFVARPDSRGSFELQKRVSPEWDHMLDEIMSHGDKCSQFITRAWAKAFGRNLDPNGACFDAVSAIEIIARPIVLPNEPKAALGKIAKALLDKPEKWTTELEGEDAIATISSMMNLVWTSHFRHGNEDQPIEVSQRAAEMIVQLALITVQWFRLGQIKQDPAHFSD